MSSSEQDTAEPYIRRREKNLRYFRKSRPELYDYFKDLQLNHVELVVTPGEPDVDMVDNGRSVYRNQARAYSRDEVRQFLAENPGDRWMTTLAPQWTGSFNSMRFASRAVKRCVELSGVTPESFRGYRCGGSFPSVIFLGCGLAYHIEALVEQADLVDAVIFEPDPERFAATLFTVDWEDICSRFRRNGRNIAFSIATHPGEENVRRVLGDKLAEILPLYPYLSVYYNHLANVELARIAMDLQKDIPILGANWGGYDYEVRGLKNIAYNLAREPEYIVRQDEGTQEEPFVIVGSGPSVDDRIGDIRAVRDRVKVVSAGTGLRVLLGNGIVPDYHVELDADYSMYEMLSDIGAEALRGITFISSLDINPLVSGFFERHLLFLKRKSYLPGLLGLERYAFDYCNPTCTNAALAISHGLGASRIFLFGTDYGYRDEDNHHSRHSVYGDEVNTEFADAFKARKAPTLKARKTFPVPSVDGGEVMTRSDFYTAKRNVEQFITDARAGGLSVRVFNCSDGALIEGADWISSDDFLDKLTAHPPIESRETGADSITRRFSDTQMLNGRLRELSGEIRLMARELRDILGDARLSGRKDLTVLANRLRTHFNRIGPGSGRKAPIAVQTMGYQMLKGTLQHFVAVGLCQGLAHEADDDVVAFSRGWKRELDRFLVQLPDHFDQVIFSESPLPEDPWLRTRLADEEPGLDAWFD